MNGHPEPEAKDLCPGDATAQPDPSFFLDDKYRDSIPTPVMPDIGYRASILAFFKWIPANYRRG